MPTSIIDLDTLFDNAPVAFVYFDADLCIRHANRRAKALFAPTGMELTGLSVATMGITDIDEAMLHQALAGANVVRLLRIPSVVGDSYIEATCSLVPNGEGRPGVLLTAIDVTARELTMRQQAASTEELQAILDNLSEGVWLIEPDGSQRYRNPAGRHLLGISDDQPDLVVDDYARLDARYPNRRIVPPTELPRFRAARGEAMTGLEMYLTGLDGVRRLLKVDTNALRDEQGNVRLGFNLMRDITAQRELELDYKARNEELQAILANLSDAVFLVDPEGDIRYINRAGRELLGIEPEQQFQNIREFMHMKAYYLDGQPMPLEQRPFFRSIKGESFSNAEILLIDLRGAQRLISTSALPIRDEQGNVRLGLNVARDITGQREIERQIDDLLMQSEAEQQRLFSVIDQMPEGVLIISAPAGGLLAMNKTARELLDAETLDLTPGSTSYETLQVFGPDDSDWPLTTWPIARALRGETVIGVQLRVARQKGQRVDLLVNAAPIYDRSGGREVISGAIGVFQDISELKELDRLKDDFISITSHELRTPLTTIKGYGQLLTRKLARLDLASGISAELQKPIDTILERTERMIAMINDLLDVSRIATGRLEVAVRAIDLSGLVTRCVEQVRLTSRLPIALQTPDEVILAVGEERLVEQVINNLLANAVKYGQAGNISVTLARDEQNAIVQVRDEGIGIALEQQEHLFERFYRAERSKGMASGLGLGLYISHGIITAHGGRLWVESEGPGRGSTFSFTVPLMGR